MRERRRPEADQHQPSDALADIALNSLGLILIVLFVCMISFHRATAAQASASGTVQAPKQQEQDRDKRVLRSRIAQLEQRIETLSHQDQASGLWRFRVHVTRLVGLQNHVEPADFVIDYFIWLQIKNGRATGSLFGVKEHTAESLGSASHANISGSFQDDNLNIELAFTGRSAGGSEILRVKKQGDQFVGLLLDGTQKPGHRNYAGKAVGTRLNESVFSS